MCNYNVVEDAVCGFCGATCDDEDDQDRDFGHLCSNCRSAEEAANERNNV